MDTRNQTPLQAARETVRQLRCWQAEPAPPAFAAHVLARVGLADAYSVVETPVGPVFVAYNDQGISQVLQAADAPAFEAQFQAQFGRLPRYAPSLPPALADGVRQLLEGEPAPVQFDLRGLTPFEQAVLQKAREIPRGEVRPYSWIAREIGHPAAVRAAGSALGRNPVPILVPCHRVVRSDGATGNYGFGPQLKVDLLQVEQVNLEETRQLGRRGVHYLASETTRVFCYPSCNHARRISPTHRVEVANVTAATHAGYRPCRHCRPA